MWIWAPTDAKTPDTVFFRHRFRLAQKPLSAKLRIAADDVFVAYFNGNREAVARGNDWTVVQEFDVTRSLRAGENLLTIEATNNDGPGGLLYKLVLMLPGNRSVQVISDARVRVLRRPPPTWTTFAFEDRLWPAAREIAPAGGGVWGALRGAPIPDPTRIVRLWDIRAGANPSDPVYNRVRVPGDRMLLSTNVASPSEMQILSGAGFTLFQSDSDHLSTNEVAPNQWNWAEAEAQRRAVQRLGLDWAYFPHCAFPPAWMQGTVNFTRLHCLEHQLPIQAFSIWDPTWPDFVGRNYAAMAQQFTEREGQVANPANRRDVSALCVGIHGDYGEAGFFMGARVADPGQKANWQNRFGDVHNHYGYWCHDPLARADFRNTMLQKYGGLAQLNAVWKRSFRTPDEIDYPQKPRAEARREWLDFINWYHDAVGRAVEINLAAARKHFPNTLLMVPAGFMDEDPRGGNDNSLIPKIAAKYQAGVRSTHSGVKPFAENAATMLGRLGSACRFYNVPFWLEASLARLTQEQEVERLFEAISQGASGLYGWAGNTVQHRDVYYRYNRFLRVEKPITDVAMFYPAMAQKIRTQQGYAPLFQRACSLLRDVTNFDIVDDRMVLDDCLSRYRLLILWEGTMADQAVLDKIKAWVAEGGVLVGYDFGRVPTFEDDLSWYREMFGYANELSPARVTEQYVGTVPAQYRLQIGLPESADYLVGEWFETEMEGGIARRWAGASASIRLPVDPTKRYTLIVRVNVPQVASGLKRRVLINGQEIGQLASTGDVTYRFPVTPDMLNRKALSTLSIESETYQPAMAIPDSKDMRRLGLQVVSVQMQELRSREEVEVSAPPGTIRRELDIQSLRDKWTRRYGKGLTVYFPATRQLIYGYIEVIRYLVYRLSGIEAGRRNALPIDTAFDGVYATLFTDKILFYNSKDTHVTKTVTIPSEAFVAWRGEVAIPSETIWKLTLEPHSIEAIYLTPPPQELLFECEEFTERGGLATLADSRLSPGRGATCVRLSRGASIATRFLVEVPGRYAIYFRGLRNGKLEDVDILVDGQPIASQSAKAGQTYFCAVVALTRGPHTLTLRAKPNRDVLADFVLLTNDPTIAGYDFAMKNASVE
jgi:hypothetical protein